LPSEGELQRLIDALPEPYCTMVLVVCVSGVRIGELLALRWPAVDWKRKCLWVVEAVNRGTFQAAARKAMLPHMTRHCFATGTPPCCTKKVCRSKRRRSGWATLT
jgi:site-specific recombinase XerD